MSGPLTCVALYFGYGNQLFWQAGYTPGVRSNPHAPHPK